MKFIAKGNEPQAYAQWKAQANANWTPTYAILGGAPKHALKQRLMAEQGFICCYCERELTEGDSHIEHFRPQSDIAVDPLDFNNMLCSCNPEPGRGRPSHCGNLKDDWFDPNLLISPLDPACENRFSFTGDGHIKAAIETDLAATETVNRLGLDIQRLVALRSGVIDAFLDDSLSFSDFKKFVTSYLTPDAQGRFSEFWTTIRYLF
jgi:uncharacterized protein (TIGR02646 family)